MTTITDIAAEIADAEAAVDSSFVMMERAIRQVDYARDDATCWGHDGALAVRESEKALRVAQDDAAEAVAFLDRLRARAATAAA
jgi:hypothetical protein